MKSYLYLLGCLLLFCAQSYSQERIIANSKAKQLIPFTSEIHFSKNGTVPSLIVFDKNANVNVEQFFNITNKAFNNNETSKWKIYSEGRDKLGYSHLRFQQYYQNVKVETGQYILHVKNGKVLKANGVYYPNIDIDPRPVLSEFDALNMATNYCGASLYKWQLLEEEKWIKDIKKDSKATFYPKGELVIMARDADFKSNDMRLAWKFNIYAHEPESRHYYYIDAHNGELIYKENKICSASSTGTAVTMYSGTRDIITDSLSANSYRLRDATRGGGVETYDMNNGTSYGAAVDFTDTDNFWNTTTNDDHAAYDAHWGAENTYDYYLLEHGRNSFDDLGTAIKSYVHRGVNYNNAFWNGSVMTYGDGDGATFTPLTALDVVGHEITHGVTEFSSNLVYSYESGALNESFSDIFGAAIEYYALGDSLGDWIVGEDMTPSGTGIRNMMNPKGKSDPDTYLGAFWHTSSSDNGGVHTNSGVQNHWFYLLTEGGSGTNDNNDVYSIIGLGISKASKIAYRNNNVYLTSSSQYSDARNGAIQSAIDLYGPCSPEVESTTNAWYAVGVGAAYVPTVIADYESGVTTSCFAPYTFSFSNLSTNAGTFHWDFGDGDTSNVANPDHTYSAYGSFDVTLISDGGVCGIDTIMKTSFINIDSLLPCIAMVGDPTQTACSGVIYDPGGPTSNYDDNINAVTTISPINAATVTLTFNSFDIEPGSASTCNWDYVEIFDGPNLSATSLGRYCNTTGSPGTIISTGPSLTIQFYSDAAVTHAGFDATWSCVLNTAPPSTEFSSDVNSSCDGQISFYNLSGGVVDSVHWDFGDGNTSNDDNPVHNYLSSGIYDVTLSASNSNGTILNTKTSYISIIKPAAPVIDDNFTCGANSITFNTGPTVINWYDTITGGSLLNSGTSFTTPFLNSNATYFAEELHPALLENVGPVDNTFGGGAYFTGLQSLIFDCYKPTKLVSVWVDAQTVGTRTIELRDNSSTILQDTTIMITTLGGQRLTLNFNIPVGSDMQLGVGNSPNLYRNNTNVSYPYEIPGLISITRSTATSNPVGFYYFFYDWIVQGPPCPSERDSVTAFVYNAVETTTSIIDNQCFGDETGSINIAVNSGSAPFNYLWSNGEVTQNQINLLAGIYTLTVTDSNSCTEEIVSTITEGDEIILTSSKRNVSCAGGSDGDASVNVSGGVPPYTTSWNTSPVQTTNIINNLTPSFYTATVTDNNGCTTEKEFEIREPDPLIAFYIPTNPTSANNDGHVNQLVSGGINPYTYSWSNGATTEDLSNVGAGTYYCTVVDRNGCAVLIIVVLTVNGQIISNQTNSLISHTNNVNKGLFVYPNPIKGNTKFEFFLNEPGTYLLNVLDLTGRLLFEYKNHSENAGIITLESNLAFLSKGVYLVQLNTKSESETIKVTKN